MGASSIKQTFKILDKILMADEEVEKVVVSKNTSSSFYHRSALIATDKRVLLIEPKYLGLTYQFQDYDWLEVIDIHLKEGIFSAKISLSPLPGSGPALVLGSLKKSDARHFYQYGNERISEMDDLRRERELEMRRAGAGGTTSSDTATDSEDSIVKLQRLKRLFEEGLITEQEFLTKKEQLLDEML
ncbi:MAG: PH domain-containing protein [Bacteroidota bacterium]